MSTAPVRKKILSGSYKHLFGAGLVLTGCGGLGAYVYYRRVWLPAYYEAARRKNQRPPVRRTPLYVAGTADGEGLLPEPRTMPTLLFYPYVAYRMLLLFVGSVPVLWYAFLTFGLKLCPRRVLYLKVRAWLASMGPSYIKLGQWMATRPDFFPPELCAVLEELYDNSESHSWANTEKTLRRIYLEGPSKGKNALSCLAEIEKVPVNSGSIAQVHRAVLRDTVDGVPAGTTLAVKVTHPYIREQVAADVAAMRVFVRVANAIIPGFRLFNFDSSIREFSSLIRSQLNLLIECDNIERFRFNFRDFNGVFFPKPLPSLCTEDVLFETFEGGEPLQNVQCSEDNRGVAELGCHMFLKMLFEDNFTHSDLHPGNLFLRTNSIGNTKEVYPDGKQKLEHELIVLDAGLVTTLSKEERNNFISLFAAVACGDGELAADLMIDRLPANQKGEGAGIDRDKFRREMVNIFDMVSPQADGFRLSNVQLGAVLGRIMSVVRETKTPLDGNFSSLVLTVMVGEGLGRKLVPDFNIFAEAAPYMVAFLEDEELYFLANKLRQTYGAAALLRDSMELVRPEKASTYAEVIVKKTMHALQRLFPPKMEMEEAQG